MERDLQLARQVQESFLPGKPPEVAGVQFCARYKAALQVGGDFYDFIPLASGKLGIVVGDVAGKGIPAALLMARMTSDVRFFSLNEDDPGLVVGKLNSRLCAGNADDSFVTLIFGILDPATRVLRFANAAHPPPVLRKGNTGQISEVQTNTNFPVGAVDGAEFQQESVTLEPGDILCLYSDGITEAMDAAKNMYGSERLAAAVGAPKGGVTQVMENILRDVQAHVGNPYQSDDLTLVCLGAV
jgi:sigma-B regulation protein RsbU (phosphoserine phosphatase)